MYIISLVFRGVYLLLTFQLGGVQLFCKCSGYSNYLTAKMSDFDAEIDDIRSKFYRRKNMLGVNIWGGGGVLHILPPVTLLE